MNEEIKRLQAELAETKNRVKELEYSIGEAVSNHVWAVVNSINLDDGKRYIARRVDSYDYFTSESAAAPAPEARERLVIYLSNDWEAFNLFDEPVVLTDNKIKIARYTYEIVEAEK